MKNMRKLSLGLLAAVILFAATAPQIPVWISGRYQFVTLGPGWLTALAAPAPTPVLAKPERVYGTVLVCTDAGCPLPANATQIVVWINKLRVTPGVDYIVTGTLLDPSPMIGKPYSDSEIVIDYTPGL